MAYVNPKLRIQFESLSIDVKNKILRRGAQIHTVQDLQQQLEQITGKKQ